MDVDSSVCIIIYAKNVLAGLELVVGFLNDITVTPPPSLGKVASLRIGNGGHRHGEENKFVTISSYI